MSFHVKRGLSGTPEKPRKDNQIICQRQNSAKVSVFLLLFHQVLLFLIGKSHEQDGEDARAQE